MLRKLIVFCAAVMACATAGAQQWDNYRSKLRNKNVQIVKTNLPIVFMNVQGKQIDRTKRILARMKIIDNGSGQFNYGDTVAYPNQTVDYEGYVALKYRGNSSFDNSDKKPYSFRPLKTSVLPDDGGDKDKVKILGMGKDNDWALLAPFSDKSMMRDVLTFELARPYFRFVPHARYCELILDGTYYGIFILTERPTKGKQRLDLHDPGKDGGDLTGDYHVEIDRADDPYYLSKYYALDGKNGNELTNKTIKYQYKEPEEEDFADLPVGTNGALIREIDRMEDAFYASNYREPDGYRKYINVTSFIDYMLATEFAYNIDGYRLSTGLYKYSKTRAAKEGLDDRWQMLLWDFNIAYGNANYNYGERTDLWQYDFNTRAEADIEFVPFYWYRLLDDPAYVNELKERWKTYRTGSYTEENITAKIDSIAHLLTSGGAMERNQMAYETIGRSVWPNYFVGKTYASEIDYLKGWITRRLQFMDRELLPHELKTTEPVAVKAMSYNADMVVEALPASTTASNVIDDAGRTFYSAGLKGSGGLPEDGIVTSSYEGIKYKLAPYTANNAIRLRGVGAEATVELEQPVATSSLCMLCTSGNNASQLSVVLNYADNTSSLPVVVDIRNWSVRNPEGNEAIVALGNINRSTGTMSSDNHYCMFDVWVRADKTKQIKSLSLKLNSSTVASIFAFARVTDSATGISQITVSKPAGSAVVEGIYSVSGIKQQALQKGVNIIRYTDGTIRKVVER